MRILALGDGNFSFSLALLRQIYRANCCSDTPAKRYLGLLDYSLVDITQDLEFVCTSFDSFEEVISKYPESTQILRKLENFPGVKVMHGINAWELRKHFGKMYPDGFDVIYWNHPHLGTENYKLHRFLMAHFLQSSKEVLSGQLSSIIISLVEGQEIRWNLIPQAAALHLYLDGFQEFFEADFPGYQCKRNKNGQSFKNDHTKKHVGTLMRSFFYNFRLSPNSSPKGELEFPIFQDQVEETVELLRSAIDLNKSTNSESLKQVKLYDPDLSRDRRYRKLSAQLKNIDWSCPACDKRFSWFGSCRNHYHIIHELGLYPLDDQKYECTHEKCKKIFSRLADYNQHMLIKHSVLSDDEKKAIWKDGTAKFIHKNSGKDEPFDSAYNYTPCQVCGQAVVVFERDGVDYGMKLHLEQLKPVIGMRMQCPRPSCDSHKTFMDHRALEQHFLQCRSRI